MSVIEKTAEYTVYESPQTQQPPLHARMPGVAQVPSGDRRRSYNCVRTGQSTSCAVPLGTESA